MGVSGRILKSENIKFKKGNKSEEDKGVSIYKFRVVFVVIHEIWKKNCTVYKLWQLYSWLGNSSLRNKDIGQKTSMVIDFV